MNKLSLPTLQDIRKNTIFKNLLSAEVVLNDKMNEDVWKEILTLGSKNYFRYTNKSMTVHFAARQHEEPEPEYLFKQKMKLELFSFDNGKTQDEHVNVIKEFIDLMNIHTMLIYYDSHEGNFRSGETIYEVGETTHGAENIKRKLDNMIWDTATNSIPAFFFINNKKTVHRYICNQKLLSSVGIIDHEARKLYPYLIDIQNLQDVMAFNMTNDLNIESISDLWGWKFKINTSFPGIHSYLKFYDNNYLFIVKLKEIDDTYGAYDFTCVSINNKADYTNLRKKMDKDSSYIYIICKNEFLNMVRNALLGNATDLTVEDGDRFSYQLYSRILKEIYGEADSSYGWAYH